MSDLIDRRDRLDALVRHALDRRRRLVERARCEALAEALACDGSAAFGPRLRALRDDLAALARRIERLDAALSRARADIAALN
jgi:hypothetical protein